MEVEMGRKNTFGAALVFGMAFFIVATAYSVFGPVCAYASSIVINEIVHSGAQKAPDEDGETQDWIELYNPTGGNVNLDGMYLSDESTNLYKWALPDVVIGPGDYLLVFASSKDRTDPAGDLHTNFNLSSGDPVLLVSENDGLIDEVTSSQSSSIPSDHSLGRLPDGSGDFTALSVAGPGRPNIDPSDPFPGIVINEVMASNDSILEYPAGSGQYPDWIELYNPGSAGVDIKDYTIYGDDNAWVFAQSQVIPAGGYLIVYANDADIQDPPQTDFKIGSGGETVTLKDDLGNTIDQVVCPAMVGDESYGRFPDGSTNLEYMSSTPTPGAVNQSASYPANPDAQYIVVNEVVSSNGDTLYDYQGDTGDWIELYNTSPSVSVNMKNLVIGDSGNKWKFPDNDNLIIPPDGYLIVWADGKDCVVDRGGGVYEAHTSFKISSSGDSVTLYNTDWGTVEDTIDVPGIARDNSYGRYPDGSSRLREMEDATPWNPNTFSAVSANTDAVNIAINEIVTNNVSGITDEDGDHSGWLELYNKGNVTVDMEGLRLSDGESVWAFPSGETIAAGEYLVVFLSDKGRDGGELHTNFTVSALEGGTLSLVNRNNPDFTVVESVDVPPLSEDSSYSRSPDGTGSFRAVTGATPGLENSGISGKVYEYYPSGRVKSVTYSPAENGVVYEEYIDEDWQGSGRGRIVSKVRSSADADGALSFIYDMPLHVKFADLDGDGGDDMLLEYSFGFYKYVNGSLSKITTALPSEVLNADIDGDTRDDLVLKYDFGLYEFVNGVFSKITTSLPDEMAVADLNGDGVDDLVLNYDFGLHQYVNGNLERITEASPFSMLKVNLNGGSRDDLVLEYDFGLYELVDGSFSKITTSMPSEIKVADLNGNGSDDLVLKYEYGLHTYTGGSLHKVSTAVPSNVEIADLDGDGVDDLVLNYDFGLHEYVSGSFSRITSSKPTNIMIADIEGDSKKDLVLEYDFGLCKYVDGSFSSITSSRPTGVRKADLNGDNKEDLVLEYSFGLYKYVDGSFSKITTSLPGEVEIADLDGDGADDLVLEYDFGLYKYANGNFSKITETRPLDIVVADLDGDGADDLVLNYDFGLCKYSGGVFSRITESVPFTINITGKDSVGKQDLVLEYDFGVHAYADGNFTKISSSITNSTTTEEAYANADHTDLVYTATYDAYGNLVNKEYQQAGAASLNAAGSDPNIPVYTGDALESERGLPHSDVIADLREASSGEGVTLALLDSGIGAEDVLNPAPEGTDFTGGGTTEDEFGHGTATAGVIRTLAGKAHVLNVKTLDENGETTTGIVASAINYAADMGSRIIAMPFGLTIVTDSIKEAISYAANKGSILIAAAGNEGSEIKDTSLAAQEGVVTVGSVDNDGKLSAWSNYGEEVDLYAPWDIIEQGTGNRG
ncbi:MAG: S8 family serine peptidase, partial [Candidatus Omnitrophica bacterium]|nr:S8 family serine peptidase [Candidatus Omnitrophota bacterium]